MSRQSLPRLLPLLLGLSLVLAAPARAGDEDDEGAENAEMAKVLAPAKAANEAYEKKDYEGGIKKFEEFFALLEKSSLKKERKESLESNARYDYACCFSLSGKKDEALKALARSLELGWGDWKHIEEDKDFDPIRDDEGFKKAIEKGKADQSSRCAAEVAKALAEKPLFDYDFDLKTLDGKTLKLADLKGKVVIVDIWGTWCPPCRAEIPHFVKLYEKYREKGLEIVGIACERTDDDETSKVVEKFAAEHGIKYPLALNEHGKAEKSVKPSFAGYPTTLFIDRDGKLRLKEIGYHPLEALEAYTKALLDAKAADEPK